MANTTPEERPWANAPASRPNHKSLTLALGFVATLVLVGLLVSALRGGNQGRDGSTTRTTTSSDNPPDHETAPKPRNQDGVRVGHARTEEGAKAAAAAYQDAQSTAEFLANKHIRHKVTNLIMAPSAQAHRNALLDQQVDEMMSKLGINPDGKTDGGAPLINRQAILSADVSSFSKDVATVKLWTVAVTGVADADSKMPPTSEFNGWNYTLQWIDGDWKAVTISRSEGLVPQATDSVPSPAGLFASLGGDMNAPSSS